LVWDFNAAFQLPQRLAFWDRHPLNGTLQIVLPCDHKPFSMYIENDDTVVKTLYWGGFFGGWEPTSLRLWSALAARSRHIFDVGAYTGIYGLLAATSNPAAVVRCFEGSRRNFERVIKNIQINALGDRIEGVHAVVSEIEGEAVLYEHYVAPNILSSIHSMTKQKGTPTPVRSVRLDTFADIDLIKIDVEGAEESVLRGMRGTFERGSPHILMEANSPGELKKSWGYMPDRYRCFAIDEGKANLTVLTQADLASLAKLADRNFLFSAALTHAEALALLRA
jgi:FkbM family methyltransferase